MAPKRILLIDDEWDNLECVQEFLQGEFDVMAACGGEAGLDCLNDEHPFDAVVLDLNMPQTDGFEVMRVINRTMNGLPVLLASAVPKLDEVTASIGATDFIMKPFRFTDLRDKLRTLTRMDMSVPARAAASSGGKG